MLLSILTLVSLLAFCLSAWLTSRFVRPDSRFYILDHPNGRSLHTRPTPRTGGIAIVTASIVMGVVTSVCLVAMSPRLSWLAGAMLLVAAVSFLDDRLGLSSGLRMLAHIVAAVALASGGFTLSVLVFPDSSLALSPAAAAVTTVLFIAWMINLYNFMDGMDGFAGGMAVFGFGTFALFGMGEGQWLFAALNLIVAAAAAGFLLFNFPPARIFMGDTGSSSLGLLAAAFSIWGAQEGVFPFWIALIVFSPFIVDATVTLLRRAGQGDKVWQAHRTHYYQRVVQAGWGHRKTVAWEYGIMAACMATALVSKNATPAVQWGVIGFWIVVYLSIALAVKRLEQKRK